MRTATAASAPSGSPDRYISVRAPNLVELIRKPPKMQRALQRLIGNMFPKNGTSTHCRIKSIGSHVAGLNPFQKTQSIFVLITTVLHHPTKKVPTKFKIFLLATISSHNRLSRHVLVGMAACNNERLLIP